MQQQSAYTNILKLYTDIIHTEFLCANHTYTCLYMTQRKNFQLPYTCNEAEPYDTLWQMAQAAVLLRH